MPTHAAIHTTNELISELSRESTKTPTISVKIEKASLYMASNGPLTLFVLRYIFKRFCKF
jgi:hypothetical protein